MYLEIMYLYSYHSGKKKVGEKSYGFYSVGKASLQVMDCVMLCVWLS